jgi:DNA repair protein RadC
VETGPNPLHTGVVVGAWGTALAGLLGGKGFPVDPWAYEKEIKQDIREHRENRMFLPGIRLPSGIRASNPNETVGAGKGSDLLMAPAPDSKHQEGHRKRLREKFLSSGLAGFHDYEVIELLLTLTTPRKDQKGTAKRAMERFKSLRGVLEASAEELREVKGIGTKNQLAIRLIKAVADRYLEKRLVGRNILNNSRDLFGYLQHTLGHKQRERFQVLFLDAKNNLLTSETLFEGTLTASSVYPREVIGAAIRHNAAALICAHNHPSGDPTPSPEDLALTRQLVFAARVMGITVHEHIVVGHDRYFSFADRGHMARLNREYETLFAATPILNPKS